MILTCPACATQYRLKDGAIPPEGRQVRCAACKHKWHQDGDVAEPAPETAAHDDDAPAAAADQTVGIAPPQPDPEDIAPPVVTVPEAASRDAMIAEEPQPVVETVVDDRPEPAPAPAMQWTPDQPEDQDDNYFAAIPAMHDEDEPRRSRLGWFIGLVLLVVAAAAAFYFFAPPELKARAGIAEAGASPLEVVVTTSDRQRLASGNELLAISGRVINLTDREQAVPPIHAELRDPANNRLVYQWTIAAPARSLGPGQAASFNSAEVDVPKAGKALLTLRFAS